MSPAPLIAASRVLGWPPMRSGYLDAADNPALKVDKPRRPPSTRAERSAIPAWRRSTRWQPAGDRNAFHNATSSPWSTTRCAATPTGNAAAPNKLGYTVTLNPIEPIQTTA
jgi:hypothetical protein